MDLAHLSLTELRNRLGAIEDEAELERWSHLLAGDARAGARNLGQACVRRIEAARKERSRHASLFALREELFESGIELVAGIDEVGVGPLAGPVVAAAVVLPARVWLPGVNDSKKLSKRARERLNSEILKQAIAVGIGEVQPEEIDRLNILRASLEAMRRAVEELPVAPEHLLIDARTIPQLTIPQTPLINGDARDGSIAAASIVAKVHRDALMLELDLRYPGYGLAQHKGYGTADHLKALAARGPSPIHRRSFAPVASAQRQ